MKFQYLSYPISQGMPVYGGRAKLDIKAKRSISAGDAANVYKFSLESHWGTHVDAPRHFFDYGKCIVGYPPENWIFTKPCVIDIVLEPSEILNIGRWTKKIKPACDILIFKSGWSGFRKLDKYIYINPGIHPDLAIYLRRNYRDLRAIGIDWISVSSFKNRGLGHQAHRAFLNPKGAGKPLLIVEDMRLTPGLSGLLCITILPILISGIDSSPCTILAGFDD